MRVAPIGLACRADLAFQSAVDTAALTHGHPTALASTGFLSTLYNGLNRGEPLPDAIGRALEELRRCPGHEESLLALEHAVSLAGTETPDPGTACWFAGRSRRPCYWLSITQGTATAQALSLEVFGASCTE
jgi:hypothetical protein